LKITHKRHQSCEDEGGRQFENPHFADSRSSTTFARHWKLYGGGNPGKRERIYRFQ